jgi:hypothetical protein
MDSGGFARTYGVQLLCRKPPQLELSVMHEALRKHCPHVERLDPDPAATLLAFAHPDHVTELVEGPMPAQTLITETEKPFGQEAAIQQSWSFPQARSVVAQCTDYLLVTDVMASALDYKERLALFQRVLLGTLAVVDCAAIHWLPSQQIVSPEAFLKAMQEGGSAPFFCGASNVRLFNVEGTEDTVMDTLGLAALGLPDLQCHFHDLEVNDVARILPNLAFYLFENGNVIEDGHTVTGTSPEARWRCRRAESLVPPEREVLDIDPGPFAAAGTSL